jgi:hypothetical protein
MGETGCLKDGNFQNLQVGGRTILGSSVGAIVTKSVTSGTIPQAVQANAVPPIKQPAGTFIKDVFFTGAGNIVTQGGGGDHFRFKIGTAADGGEIVANTNLLNNPTAVVTWVANVPLPVIKDGMGQAADAFTDGGIGPPGGPATSEAIVLAGATYSAAARDFHVTFETLANTLTTADTTIKVVIRFMYI